MRELARHKPCTIVVVVAIVLGTVLGWGPVPGPRALAADNNQGYRDFSFSATEVSHPAGEKPQSKLWFNDGTWWAILFDRSTEEYHIYRYDQAAHSWSDTGTLVDERNSSKADALSDGNHLYVASAGPYKSSTIYSARVLRYTYDPATQRYSLDAGFPVTITNGGMEAIVLAKDTTGELWATYTQGSKVYITHTLGDDKSWAAPFILPVRGTSVSPDDISSVVAFGSQIGVMWSNEAEDAYYFATHKDGDPEGAWQQSTALQGEGMADDHINLKADSSGRVFAAVKTSLDDVPNQDPNAPLNLLLVRDRDGGWSSHVFGTVRDRHTRPIVLIDEEQRALYMFATAPWPGSGNMIYSKRTNLDNISFPEGRGSPFIESPTDTNVWDVTSTKQNLDSTTNLLVEASDDVSGYYLHNFIDLSAVDTLAPQVRPPEQGFVPNSTLGTTTVPVGLSWSAVDGESGVSEYRLQESANNSSYADLWLPSATTTSRTRQLSPGKVYQYRVQATDGAGNQSEWAYGPKFSVYARQETSDTITYDGDWTQENSINAFGGARRYTSGISGQTATFTFTGSQVAWIATQAYNRGRAEVYVDGVKATTVDLYSASGLGRSVAFAMSWPASGTHKLEVRALGTKNAASSGTRVDVDAFVTISSADDEPPNVTLTAPAADGTVSGTAVTLSADATDNGSVDRVEFLVDSNVIGSASNAPYSVGWDSERIPDGFATIAARAFDFSNNTTTSINRRVAVNNTYPDTAISSGPSGTSKSTSATFEFSSTERDSTFRCSLDGVAFDSCTSPKDYTNLGGGEHSLRVYAVGAGGEADDADETPATYTWTVDDTPPI